MFDFIKARLLVSALMLCTTMTTRGSAQDAAAVMVENGALQGVKQGEINAYLGVPYAMPPLGELRWTPPQPTKPWSGTLEATKFGSQCPQEARLRVFAKAGGEEDCLYLNVYSGNVGRNDGTKRPVMVWIHGGGYSVGAGSDYDGAKLAERGKVVVVTLNYRLGILGFMAHPKLDAERHPFANYGLMDQQLALKWIKANIEKFGGDPDNITIFGESSGGTSVMSHIINPDSAGLFHHAISMSGSAIVLRHPSFAAPRPLDFAQGVGTRYAEAAGCADQSPACLRALPLEKVVATQAPFLMNNGIIDGSILPIHYVDAFTSGKFNRVTLINGSNLDEWRWSAAIRENVTGKAMTEEEFRTSVKSFYGEALAPKVIEQYALEKFGSPAEAYGAAVTDSLHACTGRRLNRILSEKMPIHVYEFADRTAPSYLKPTTFPLGAAHTLELAYIFPGYHGGEGIQTTLNPLQQTLADKITDYWVNVAKIRTRTEWPTYDPAQENIMTFKLPEPTLVSGRFAKMHNCAFWDEAGIY